ncbi:MAG: hypothetical protein EA428_02435 [Spirochaetaceae bacterium]|nr:MAG: hypothetical protein EA428_02435 [Spirochaetaceae bacterium]
MRPFRSPHIRALVLFTLLLSSVLSVGELHARRLHNEQYGYYIDLPVGWNVIDAEDLSNVGFADPLSRAVVQVFAFERERFGSMPELVGYFRNRYDARGDESEFRYQGAAAVLADLSFAAGQHPARGYFTFISDREYWYVVSGFAPVDDYEIYHDTLLSAVDSFALGEVARRYPGPISQFYYPYPAPNTQEFEIALDQYALPLPADEGEIEASEVLIEREARLLNTWYRPGPSGGDWEDAWRRFYRTIYRDNFMRLAPLVPELLRYFAHEKIDGDDVPAELLRWLQSFAYRRVGGEADVQAPLSSLISGSGDCDSLGVVYAILLHHLGYDAILMVSHRFGHAMVGVDIPGSGARFPFEGREWLVAELTAPVAIGQIDQEQADPAGWIGVDLR